jgi:hypothetical protein
MALVTLDGGQSSAALGGQTISYISLLVAQTVSGCPDTLIQTHLARVLVDFYTRSTAWRVILGPLAVNAGQDIIELNPVDQDARLQFVLGAYRRPSNVQYPQILPASPVPIIGGNPGPPCSYTMERFDRLKLWPVPDQDYGKTLFVWASLVPTTMISILPDMSYTHHLEGLTSGLLSRLYGIPKRPWSDNGLAAQHNKIYRQEVAIARDEARRGYGPADAWTRFPRFAGRAGSQMLPRASG